MVTVFMGSNIVTNSLSAIVVLAEMDEATLGFVHVLLRLFQLSWLIPVCAKGPVVEAWGLRPLHPGHDGGAGAADRRPVSEGLSLLSLLSFF